MAACISRDFGGKDTVLLGVLKGALIFMADVMRGLDMDYRCEFVSLSSYGDGMESSGRVRVVSGLSGSIERKHVLVIDCVVDTGRTLNFLMDHLREKGPSDIKTCVLLDKQRHRRSSVQLDYVGFNIPDHFVVGYGLDLAEKHRGLPYIAHFREGEH
jgi:hypoxanthine phosphoribosyltransferase